MSTPPTLLLKYGPPFGHFTSGDISSKDNIISHRKTFNF